MVQRHEMVEIINKIYRFSINRRLNWMTTHTFWQWKTRRWGAADDARATIKFHILSLGVKFKTESPSKGLGSSRKFRIVQGALSYSVNYAAANRHLPSKSNYNSPQLVRAILLKIEEKKSDNGMFRWCRHSAASCKNATEEGAGREWERERES